MNLKRLRGIMAAALTGLAVALIAGCSNSMAGSVDSNARGVATLHLSATGIPNDYAEQFAKSYPNAGARSITPNAPYDVSTTGLTFKLSGKSETGRVLADMEVFLVAGENVDGENNVYNFVKDAANTPVTLDAMSWNLKLVAYNAAGAAVLQGFCSVDLRTGSNTATFKMGTAGLTADGSVTITGTFVDEDDAADYYTMGIYRKDTGELVTGTDKFNNASVPAGGDESFTYGKTFIAPGTYLYTMIFYAGTDDTSNIVGSFTDTLVVDPGNDLERALKIDVIGKKPTQPTALKAYLVDGSEGKDGSPTYNVKVEWGKSDYATNYELQVLEYIGQDEKVPNGFKIDYGTDDEIDTDTAANWKATTYGMRSMDPETDNDKAVKDFAGSAVYGTNAGSSYMMFGDTSCSLVLETGKVYEIRLRGRNYIGVSKFAERVLTADDTANGLTGISVGDEDHINRLLVTYHLNGGTLTRKAGENDTDKEYENTYATYKSWKPSLALVNRSLISDGNAYEIKNGTTAWESWLFEKGEGVQADDGGNITIINSDTIDASKEKLTHFTYKNLTVLASYGNKVTGSISMADGLKDIDPSKISVELDSGTLSPKEVLTGGAEGDIALTKYTVTKTTDGTSQMLKIVLDTGNNNSIYKDVSFTLIDSQNKQKTIPLKESRTCEIDLSYYPTGGKIQVIVSAVTNKTTTVSQTIIFDLQ